MRGVSLALAIFLATVVQMVVGELVPKGLAIARPERTTFLLAPIVRIYGLIFGPVIRFLNSAANRTVRLLGVEPTEELSHVGTLAELRVLVRTSNEEGTLADSASAAAHPLDPLRGQDRRRRARAPHRGQVAAVRGHRRRPRRPVGRDRPQPLRGPRGRPRRRGRGGARALRPRRARGRARHHARHDADAARRRRAGEPGPRRHPGRPPTGPVPPGRRDRRVRRHRGHRHPRGRARGDRRRDRRRARPAPGPPHPPPPHRRVGRARHPAPRRGARPDRLRGPRGRVRDHRRVRPRRPGPDPRRRRRHRARGLDRRGRRHGPPPCRPRSASGPGRAGEARTETEPVDPGPRRSER